MSPLQLKLLATDAAAGTFAGLAATFDPDRQGDIILPGAFDATLAEWGARGYNIPLLAGHDQTKPVGAIQNALVDADGLRVTGRIVTSTPAGAEAHVLAVAGALSMSIGYTVPDGGWRMVNGARHLSMIDLHEISLVAVPANPGARITEIKRASDCSTIREYEHLVRDALGLSSRDAKAVAAKSWPVFRRDGEGQRREGAPDATVIKALQILQRSNPIR